MSTVQGYYVLHRGAVRRFSSHSERQQFLRRMPSAQAVAARDVPRAVRDAFPREEAPKVPAARRSPKRANGRAGAAR